MVKVEHIEWIKNLPEAKYPLMCSDIRSLTTQELLRMGFKLEKTKLHGSWPQDSYGSAELKNELAEYYNVKNNNITVCCGANMAIYLACAGLLSPGDEIIIESPSYEPFRRAAQSLGAVIKSLPRRIENRFQPDPAELEKLITPRTKAILITNLHNPSCVKLKDDTLRKMVKLADKNRIYIICDEIYHDFLWEKRGKTFCKYSPRAISLSSLTKVYGLGAMRIGWIMASPKLTHLFSRAYDYMAAANSYPAEMIGLFCLKNISKLIKRSKSITGKKVEIVRDWISNEQRLKWIEPDGGIVCWIKLPKGANSMKLIKHLLKKYDTAIVPGEFFDTPGYIRISFGIETNLLKKGLANISKALDDLKL